MHFKLFPIINKSDRRSNVLLGILKSVHSMVDHTFNLLIGSSFSKKKCFTGIEAKKKNFSKLLSFSCYPESHNGDVEEEEAYMAVPELNLEGNLKIYVYSMHEFFCLLNGKIHFFFYFYYRKLYFFCHISTAFVMF